MREPDDWIRQDTILTPFSYPPLNVSSEDEKPNLSMKKKILMSLLAVLLLAALSVLTWSIHRGYLNGLPPVLFYIIAGICGLCCWIVCFIPVGILITYVLKLHNYILHNYIINKNRINWEEYADLKKCCVWLYITSWFFLLSGSIDTLEFFFSDEHFSFSIGLTFILISVLSFWTSFSIVRAKKNSLYLLRTFLLGLSSLISIILFKVTSKIFRSAIQSLMLNQDYENTIYSIFGLVILVLALSLCIKGLVFSFKPSVVELFKGGSLSYLQILTIVLIWVAIVASPEIDVLFTDMTQSDFPPLNTAE